MSRSSEDLNAMTVRPMLLGILVIGFLVIILIAKVWGLLVDGEAPAEGQLTEACGLSELPLQFLVDPRPIVEGKIIVMRVRTSPGELGEDMPGRGTGWLLGVGDRVEVKDACDRPIIQIFLGKSHFRPDSLPPPPSSRG